MSSYNKRMIPILAPDGMPRCLDLPDPSSPGFDQAIKTLQAELGLKPDGECGPKTISAIAARKYSQCKAHDPQGSYLVIGPHVVKMRTKVITWLDEGHEDLAKTRTSTRSMQLTLGVVHYDVTNSSSSTQKVLLKRALSTHFLIDADGTLYQCHDPITKVCFHAGNTTNPRALGVDLNSPALRKYERGARPRPEVQTEVHGRTLAMLDYWPEQISALIELMEAMSLYGGLPWQCPRDAKSQPIKAALPQWLDHQGWLGHYHITKRKIDPAPLDWDQVCPVSR